MDSFLPWIGIVVYGLPLVIIGYIYKMRPPKKINHIYGYRTRRSMKNQQVWDYANKIRSPIDYICRIHYNSFRINSIIRRLETCAFHSILRVANISFRRHAILRKTLRQAFR